MEKNFSIPDISCGHCVNTIINELSQMDSIDHATGNIEQKTITLKWSSLLTEEDIRITLESINYPAEE